MEKLYTVIAVIVGIIIGAVVIYQRTDFGPEPSPTPQVEETVTPAPTQAPTVAPTVAPTAAPTVAPTPTPVPTQVPTPTPTPIQTPSPEIFGFTIEADDNGYRVKAEDGPYVQSGSITIPQGGDAAIRFVVLEENVAFGGLEFRGGPVDTDPIPPGKSQTIFFTAQSSFSIQSFWPGSGVMKPYNISVTVNVQ